MAARALPNPCAELLPRGRDAPPGGQNNTIGGTAYGNPLLPHYSPRDTFSRASLLQALKESLVIHAVMTRLFPTVLTGSQVTIFYRALHEARSLADRGKASRTKSGSSSIPYVNMRDCQTLFAAFYNIPYMGGESARVLAAVDPSFFVEALERLTQQALNLVETRSEWAWRLPRRDGQIAPALLFNPSSAAGGCNDIGAPGATSSVCHATTLSFFLPQVQPEPNDDSKAAATNRLLMANVTGEERSF
jgi:hypothetical protein